MNDQSLSIAQLSNLAAALPTDVPALKLVEILADYEAEVTLLFTNNQISGEVELISCYYASYLIALLLVDDLNEARYLTHRFPPSISDTDPILVNSRRLLRAMWAGDHPSVYLALQRHQWPDTLKPLAERYLERFQNKNLDMLSKAYTSVTPRTAGNYLRPSSGFEHDSANGDHSSEDAVLELLIQRGWVHDTKQNLLRPAETRKPEHERNGSAHTVADMASLINLVGFLGE